MDQVALPFRIALVALLLVAALWFVALRPKGDGASEATTAPGVTGLANDVQKAQDAAALANSAAGQTSTGTGSTGTSTGATSPSASKQAATPDLLKNVAKTDPSRPLLEAVSKGRVAVMLFWNSKGSDDHAVRRAVLHLDLHSGKVLTRVVSIAKVGRYEAITRGAEILGSPTVVVINRKGEARTISGFTTTAEIDQLVGDLGGKGF